MSTLPVSTDLVDDNARLRAEIAALHARLAAVETGRAAPAARRVSGSETVELLETLLDTAPIGFGVLDLDFRFVRVNRVLAELNGIPIEQHLGRSIRELFPRLADEAEAAIRQVLATGTPVVDIESTGRTPGRATYQKHLLLSYYPLRGSTGSIVGIGVTLADVTARREAERVTEALSYASRW
jgi:PAS domain S-box-containing protein